MLEIVHENKIGECYLLGYRFSGQDLR